MNKIMIGALAIGFASSLANAGSESEEWLNFDKGANKLSAASSLQGSGINVDGFFRTSLASSGDIQPNGVDDLQGFSIDNVRINFSGAVGDFEFLIETESSNDVVPGVVGATGAGAGTGILDAKAAWNVNDTLKITAGQFRPWTLAGAQGDIKDQLFIDRSWNSWLWFFRDQGVQLSGSFDQLDWQVGIQNGADGAADELAFFGAVQFDAMGAGRGDNMGAIGADDETSLTVGLSIYDDGALMDGSFFGFDAALNMGEFSAYAEYGDYDDSYFGTGQSLYSIAGGYMFVPDEWEVALRYEDLDDLFGGDASLITLGINRYMAGHDTKWMLNFSDLSADGGDASTIQLGLTLGF